MFIKEIEDASEKNEQLEAENERNLTILTEVTRQLQLRSQIDNKDAACETDFDIIIMSEKDHLTEVLSCFNSNFEARNEELEELRLKNREDFKTDHNTFIKIMEESAKEIQNAKPLIEAKQEAIMKEREKKGAYKKKGSWQIFKDVASHWKSDFSSMMKNGVNMEVLATYNQNHSTSFTYTNFKNASSNLEFWEEKIYKKLKKGTNIFSLKKHIVEKLEQGFTFPDKYRGYFWKKLVGNGCGITKALYLTLKKKSSTLEIDNPKICKTIEIDMLRTYPDLVTSQTFLYVLEEAEVVLRLFHVSNFFGIFLTFL